VLYLKGISMNSESEEKSSSSKFLIISILWMVIGFGVVAYFINSMVEKSESIPQQLEEAVIEVRKNIQTEFDEGTRLAEVRASGHEMITVIEIDGKHEKDMIELYSQNYTNKELIEWCEDMSEFEGLMLLGAIFTTEYVDRKKRVLSRITVSKDTCREARGKAESKIKQ